MEDKLMDLIYSLRIKKLDRPMVYITHLGTAGFIWFFCAAVMIFTKKYRICAINILFSLFVNLVITNIILKNITKRERPSWKREVEILIKNPTDYSFPSGHSSSSFAAALSIFFYSQKLGIIFLILAFLIAFSRLYHFVHYPSDVIIGIFIGIFVAFLSKHLFDLYIFNILVGTEFFGFSYLIKELAYDLGTVRL